MVDILVVEDNVELKDVLERFLRHEGYQIHCVENGKDALLYLQSEEVRLLLLDIMLPDMDGFHICEEVRKNIDLPIMIMSARTLVSDQLLGYELGADDYIEKPFAIPVLLAKVKALLRRGYERNNKVKVLQDKDLVVNVESRVVSLGKKELSLSLKEFDLLLLLMKHRNKTLSKEYLFTSIWGAYSQSELSTLTVHINTLRDKIEVNAKHPLRLKTVWGVGYRYEGLE
ncbi:MAG: response regulator transcription factor [Coprobacillus sp.]